MEDTFYEDIIDRMKKLVLQGKSDIEAGHCDADDLLCEFLRGLGYDDLVDYYNAVEKWYA